MKNNLVAGSCHGFQDDFCFFFPITDCEIKNIMTLER